MKLSLRGCFYKRIIALNSIFIGLLTFFAIAVISSRKDKAENLFLSFVDQLQCGKFTEAQQSIDAATRLSPDNAYFWACRGLLIERTLQRKFAMEKFLANDLIINEKEMEHVKAAIASYRKALELNPVDDLFYHNLGWLYVFIKDEKQAEFCFRQAIQIDSKIAVYHVSLGFLKEHEGKKDSDLIEYGRAVYQLPSLLDSPFFSKLKKRMPMESQQLVLNGTQILEKELQRSKNPIAAARLAKLYLFQGEKQRAISLLEQVTKELPSLSRPWLYLGDSYQSCYRDSAMIQCYRKSAFLDRFDIFPLLRLAQYYDQQNKNSDAIQYYRKVLHALPFQYSEHARRVTRMYYSNRNDERGVVKDDLIPNGLLQYCSPIFDTSSVYLRLADLYTKNGKSRKADEYLELVGETTLK